MEQREKPSTRLTIEQVSPVEGAMYCLIMLADSDQMERPDNFAETFVIHWEEAGIVIPWPEGTSAKEAAERWLSDVRAAQRPPEPTP